MTDVRDALMVGAPPTAGWSAGRCRRICRFIARRSRSVLSILHRATGIALSVGTLLLVWWLVAAATSTAAYATVSAASSAPGSASCCCSAGPSRCATTFCAGIRHLAWDAGYGFDLPHVHRTGCAVLIGTRGADAADLDRAVVAL